MSIIDVQENSNNLSDQDFGFQVTDITDIPFVQIKKTLFLSNKRLSFAAKCVMATMICRPAGWRFNTKEMMSHFQEGRDAIRNAFAELAQNGYIAKIENRNSGKFGGVHYELCQFGSLKQCISPRPEKPAPVSPVPAKPHLMIKKDIKDKERKDKPPIVPRGDNVCDQQFEIFWNAWPGNKTSKKSSKKAWVRAKPPIDIALKSIESLQEARSLLTAANIWVAQLPNPSTWINQSRWEDEIDMEKVKIQIKNNKALLKPKFERVSDSDMTMFNELQEMFGPDRNKSKDVYVDEVILIN